MQKKRDVVESSGSDAETDESFDEQEMKDDKEENVSENDKVAGPSGLQSNEKPKKRKKRGIIYISSIPKFMNVTILREMLSQYAKIGRVFLQPDKLSREFCQK